MINSDITTVVKISDGTDIIASSDMIAKLTKQDITAVVLFLNVAIREIKFAFVETLYVITLHRYFDIPVGLINGINKVFTLAQALVATTGEIILNGIQLAASEYTVVGLILTLNEAPQAGDLLWAHYTRG